MNWIDQNQSAIILFAGFFVLYTLEFAIPLVPRRRGDMKPNILFAVILMVLNLLFTSSTLVIGQWVANNKIGLLNQFQVNMVLFFIISFLFLDFWSGYLVHYLFHKSAWLWSLHSVHHSDDLVDVTTTFRQHPIEAVIKILFNVSGVILMGIPLWILFTYITISTIHAQLEHANIKLPAKLDRMLQYFIVTPNMHKIHHSRYQQETDSNYSNVFSIWDRVFGTFNAKKDYSQIDYGLDYLESRHFAFGELLKMPFRKLRSGKNPNAFTAKTQRR
jgi:sterol desaturase/sphingolipid hydroxylase (fatty acid hydroxylase superfamily)